VKWHRVIALTVLVACSHTAREAIPPPDGRHFSLTSPAFADHGTIPPRFTCDGRNVSPPLAWNGAPGGDRLLLVLSDPDAPGGPFIHWVLALPPGTTEIAEGPVPGGSAQGRNDFGHVRYDGPCPPRGDPAHHYVFTLFAVRGRRPADLSAIPDTLRRLERRTDATATLTGMYGR